MSDSTSNQGTGRRKEVRIVTDYKHAQQIIIELDARIAKLEAALTGDNGALTRMDRAREILSKHSHTWQMLNTADIRAALKGDSDVSKIYVEVPDPKYIERL